MIIIRFLEMVCEKNKKISKKLDTIMQKFVLDGSVMYLHGAYLMFCINTLIQTQNKNFNTKGDIVDFVFAMVMLLVVLLFPVVIFFFYYNNRNKLLD